MPAFHLPEPELDSLAQFVHALNATAYEMKPEGDVEAGERFFFGKGGCSSCHMISGRGFASGPDLSAIARQLTLSELRESLTDPSARITWIRHRKGSAEVRRASGLCRSAANPDQRRGKAMPFHSVESPRGLLERTTLKLVSCTGPLATRTLIRTERIAKATTFTPIVILRLILRQARSSGCGSSNSSSLCDQQLRFTCKRLASNDDSGDIRNARVLATFLIARHRLALEAVALRQQLAVYKRKQPRPKLNGFDRLFWVIVRQIWTSWSEALILVKPETVVSWHRAGYRLFWKWRSRRRRQGRPKVTEEIRALIRRMKRENPTWGAPRIHGELLALGFEISEPTVSRYLRRLKRIPEESKASQWLAFLNNHREVIAAFDFFTVPTLSFRALYCFFAIEHGRRRILHFNVTFHPTSDWILQQLREAFPLPCPYRYVLFDNDAKFGNDVLKFLKSVISCLCAPV